MGIIDQIIIGSFKVDARVKQNNANNSDFPCIVQVPVSQF